MQKIHYRCRFSFIFKKALSKSPSKREDKLSLEMAAFESQLSKKKKKKGQCCIDSWLVSRTSMIHSSLITKLDPTPVEYVRGKKGLTVFH